MISFASRAITLVLFIASTQVHASARAWLQPDRIALGQTTTLNVESDAAAAPDFSVLQQNFALHGQSSSTQTTITNAGAVTRTLFAIELEPLKAGVIAIPALNVGGESTAPITLTVEAGSPASPERGDLIYLQAEIGTHEPYVQQPVSYTVKLYYAVALINGNVDARAPDDASMQQQGEDKNYQQEINGRRYNVFERNYLLVPEKSGVLELPAPRFQGRARSNRMDAFFDNGQAVSAIGESATLNVRPRPANAPTPWLPASSVRLTRVDPASSARTGEPLLLELSLVADGATVAQLPELILPGISGAQVFPEPPQSKDNIVAGQPQATLTRRFAIVPAQTGTLRIPEMRVGYWNTQTDQAAAAVLPALDVEVTPGANIPIAPIASAGPAVNATPASASTAVVESTATRGWQVATAVLAVALVMSLWWGWRRGNAPRPLPTAQATTKPAPLSPAALQRALAGTDLRAIAEALRASVAPAGSSIGALQTKLTDDRQRKAIVQLERALWANDAGVSDGVATLAQLREAFRDGPRLVRSDTPARRDALPPLYPKR